LYFSTFWQSMKYLVSYSFFGNYILILSCTKWDKSADVKKIHSCFSKKLCSLQYAITYLFRKAIFFYSWFISLFGVLKCIKTVLKYSCQKMNYLRDIYFMSKYAEIKYKISYKLLIFLLYLFFKLYRFYM